MSELIPTYKIQTAGSPQDAPWRSRFTRHQYFSFHIWLLQNSLCSWASPAPETILSYARGTKTLTEYRQCSCLFPIFVLCEKSLRQQHHQRLYEKMFLPFLSKLPEAFRRASTTENRFSWHCISQIPLCWRKPIQDLFSPALGRRLGDSVGQKSS